MPKNITLVHANVFQDTEPQGSFISKLFHSPKIPWPTGTLCIAGALEKAGFKVEVRDYQLRKSSNPYSVNTLTEFIGHNSADLIYISCTSSFLPYVVLACEKLKILFPYKLTVLGGIGPSGVAEELLKTFPFLDIICVGEGETTAVELAQAIKKNIPLEKVKGIAFRNSKNKVKLTPPRERLKDLDIIPRPAYHLVDLKLYNNGGISIARGCPYGCVFCNLVGMWEQKVHFRSNKSIINELLHLRSLGKKVVSFVDDTFIVDKERTKELCRLLIKNKLNIQYTCQGRVDSLDKEILKLLYDSGCRRIFFGIESGSNKILKQIKKGFTIAIALKALALTTAQGIKATA